MNQECEIMESKLYFLAPLSVEYCGEKDPDSVELPNKVAIKYAETIKKAYRMYITSLGAEHVSNQLQNKELKKKVTRMEYGVIEKDEKLYMCVEVRSKSDLNEHEKELMKKEIGDIEVGLFANKLVAEGIPVDGTSRLHLSYSYGIDDNIEIYPQITRKENKFSENLEFFFDLEKPKVLEYPVIARACMLLMDAGQPEQVERLYWDLFNCTGREDVIMAVDKYLYTNYKYRIEEWKETQKRIQEKIERRNREKQSQKQPAR